MSSIGPVKFKQRRYRSARGSGKSFILTEQQLELTERGLTPAAASFSMALLSCLTARERADFWKRVVREGPSLCTLVKLCSEAGRGLEECSTEVMDELRKQEELPDNASMVQVGLDGVIKRMNAEKNGDEVIEEGGWREASCGVVTARNDDGNRLQSRYIDRPPDGKKTKSQNTNPLGSEPFTEPKCGPETGGHRRWCKGNWTFAESLNPDVEVLDFWHAAEPFKVTADAAFESDEKASTKWFEAKRHIFATIPRVSTE